MLQANIKAHQMTVVSIDVETTWRVPNLDAVKTASRSTNHKRGLAVCTVRCQWIEETCPKKIGTKPSVLFDQQRDFCIARNPNQIQLQKEP